MISDRDRLAVHAGAGTNDDTGAGTSEDKAVCVAKPRGIWNDVDNHKLWVSWKNTADYDCTDESGQTETVRGTLHGVDIGANEPEDVVPYNAKAMRIYRKPIPKWGDYGQVVEIEPHPFHPLQSDVEALEQWYREHYLSRNIRRSE